MKNFGILLFPLILLFNSCSTLNMAVVRATSGVLSNATSVIFAEEDLEKAHKALPANILLLETFLASDPENKTILLLLNQAYVGYALGFVEDDFPDRAKILYKKGRDYGLKILLENNSFKKDFNSDDENFSKMINKLNNEDIPVLFWVANAWGNLINLSIDDPNELIDLYKVNAMMKFVEENDEKYFYGSTHLYFGTIFATTPKILGGNTEEAKLHFEKCLKITDRKFLLPLFYYAKSYAVQTQNKELFQSLLNEVINSPDDILKEQKLLNLITKEKSKRLLSKIDDLFY